LIGGNAGLPDFVHASSARMGEVADEAASLVLTGPPYFPAVVEDALFNRVRAMHGKIEWTTDMVFQETVKFAWSLRPTFDEAWRVLKPGGWMILQTRDVRVRERLVPVELVHREMMEAVGFFLYTRYFWWPRYTPLSRRRLCDVLSRTHGPLPLDPEVFLVFGKAGPVQPCEPTAEDSAFLMGGCLRSPVGQQPVRHRHQSPISVVRTLVRSYTRPGDLVVDPFAGGGTIVRAARMLGRRAIGYEIDSDSIALMRKNVEQGEGP
jgi:DNA modification methylase